jgi:hypothetical protein
MSTTAFPLVTSLAGTELIALENVGTGKLYVTASLLSGGGSTNFDLINMSTTQSLTVGMIQKNGYSWIHDFYDPTSLGFNFFAGLGAGNFTLGDGGGANYLASYNTGVGAYALAGLTTGYRNTAIGMYAATLMTTGTYNSALGFNALAALTTGASNTAFGGQTLYKITTNNACTALGNAACYNLTTGDGATAVGAGALYTCSTGLYNTAVGYNSLNLLTTANGCTAVGYNCLPAMTTGAGNTAVGYNSGLHMTTAGSNTLMGYESGKALTTGVSNVAIGVWAMMSADAGYDDTAVGQGALQYCTSGFYNTAVGQNCCNLLTTAQDNTGMGVDCLHYNLTGRGNSALGINACQMTTVSYNTAMGWYTLQLATTGANNSAFGAQALQDVTTGDLNTAVGLQAGRGITTGRANTIIGASVTGLSAALSNNVILADGDGNKRLQFDSTGIGTLSSLVANATITGALAAGAFSYGTLPYTAVGNFASFNLSSTGYTQLIVSNSNIGAVASANVIVSNNLGTDLAYYGAFGINSSGFTGTGALNLPNSTYLSCISGDLAIGTQDAHAIHFLANSSATDAITISSGNVPSVFDANLESVTAANGQLFQVKSLTELTTIAAAATTTTAIQIPAGAIVVGVSVRVVTVIPTAATFTVGDSGSAARYNTAAVNVAAGSTDAGTKAGAYYNASAVGILITPNLTPGAATGQVRTTIHYILVTPPTS